MTRNMVLFIAGLILGSWFLISEKRTPKEKFELVFAIIMIYILIMVGLGAESIEEIFKPITDFLSQ